MWLVAVTMLFASIGPLEGVKGALATTMALHTFVISFASSIALPLAYGLEACN
jgi:hypothetical protein